MRSLMRRALVLTASSTPAGVGRDHTGNESSLMVVVVEFFTIGLGINEMHSTISLDDCSPEGRSHPSGALGKEGGAAVPQHSP